MPVCYFVDVTKRRGIRYFSVCHWNPENKRN